MLKDTWKYVTQNINSDYFQVLKFAVVFITFLLFFHIVKIITLNTPFIVWRKTSWYFLSFKVKSFIDDNDTLK